MNKYSKLCLTLAALAPALSSATALAPGEYDGAALYAANCSGCHGDDGRGDEAKAMSLSVIPQDLRFIASRADGTFPRWFIEQIVDGRQLRLAHGPEGMPIWGTIFTRQEGLTPVAQDRVEAMIDALVDHIEAMQVEVE